MRTYIILLIFTLKISGINAQESFYLTFGRPGYDFISDIIQLDNYFYLVQNRVLQSQNFNADVLSDILIVNSFGEIVKEINLNGSRTYYQRILKVNQDDIYLAGVVKKDTCQSILYFSVFNIKSYSLQHLDSIEFCDRILVNIDFVEGLDNALFLDEYHYIDDRLLKSIHKIDSMYNLTLIWDSLYVGESISIDFARSGYVKATIGLYDFYDRHFNHRKQRYTNEGFLPIHETHTPFGKNFILEQGVQHYYSKPEFGLQVRLVDSNLVIRKKIVIVPDAVYYGNIDMPFYGGIDVQNENEIWSAGTFGHLDFDLQKPSYYAITKLDSNLNVICQHFLGYDARYRLYGIRALESGGAIIFGNFKREGDPVNEGEDIFALRVGENCELPTVSTNDPNHLLVSISAYPNPTINSLTFDVNGFDPSSLKVEIIDVEGTILYSKKDLSYEIKVADMPPGQYFYRILEGNKILGVGAWVKQ